MIKKLETQKYKGTLIYRTRKNNKPNNNYKVLNIN